jgi:hypothetical protein
MSGTQIAGVILTVHAVIIAFNLAGLVVIPLGAIFRWRVVRVAWLRLLHLAALAVVAGQALAGRACFLTIWENDLLGNQSSTPLIVGWVNHLIFWPLPLWVFTIIYCAVFLYVVALSVLVPFFGAQANACLLKNASQNND